jgi:quinoprotein glucose dehydrogenase
MVANGDGGPAAPPNLADLLTIDGLSIFKPPYSRITAIDMNRGEHAWMAPLGGGPRSHPLLKDLKLPPLGDGIHRASVLVTKSLLFVSVSRLGNNGLPQRSSWSRWEDADADRKLIYVFNKRTGVLLREIALDGQSAAPPMTYMYQGRQYIVVALGGGKSSELVALSVPSSKGATK